MTNRPQSLRFLAAQSVSHGSLVIFTIVPTTGLFLSTYGSKRLPYVYICVGLIGLLSGPFFSRAVARHAVVTVAGPMLTGLATLHLGSWAIIVGLKQTWPVIVLQCLLPITLQLGFLFLGSQGGRLLTTRELKAWFPTISAGFSAALLIGGLVAPALIAALENVAHVLVLASVSSLVWFYSIWLTHHQYGDQLNATSSGALLRPRTPAVGRTQTVLRSSSGSGSGSESGSESGSGSGSASRSLSLTGLLFTYQMLGAVCTQLCEYLLFNRAESRYSGSSELGRFAAQFNVGLKAFELVFLLVIAGKLVSRFGIRLGLLANPVALLFTVAISAVIGPTLGAGSVAMLLAVAGARSIDLTLKNSTTRTATNTTYQALPVEHRPYVQAQSEGIAVPAAIGLSGITLLLIEATGRPLAGGVGLLLIISALWVAAAAALFGRYRRQLGDNLSHRVLTPHLVVYGDPMTATLIDLLLESTDEPTDERAAVRPSVPYRSELGDVSLDQAALRAAEILRALDMLHDQYSDDPALLPLRDALLDEAKDIQRVALTDLASIVDPGAITKAQEWLRGDDRLRATAIESLEVHAPAHSRATMVALLELTTNRAAANSRLRKTGLRLSPITDVLADLRDDPRGVWKEPWLRACAEYATLRINGSKPT
jgi:hypothetical protein